MKYLLSCATSLCLCLATAAVAQPIRLTPVDQARRDPSLVSFRADLMAAIADRDADRVSTMACDDIYLSHGSNGGTEEFRAALTLSEDTLAEEYRDQAPILREAYWTALETTLSQPGYFADTDQFWMPFHWQIDLPDHLDPFSSYFVIARNLLLRDAPTQEGSVIARLSHELVTIPEFDDGAQYQQVETWNGTRGYAHRDYLWSMVGYRASFIKEETGDWRLCMFVAGD